MLNQKQLFTNLVKSIQKQQPPTRNLFEQIIFGKNNICTIHQSKFTSITIYFYQTIPELLVVVYPDYQERLFDLRNSAVQLQSLKHEMIDKIICNKPYLLLTNPQEELVLIFADNQEKTAFLNLLKFYKRQMKKFPQQINTLLLSTFTLIDTNSSMTISKEQISKLLLFLKLKPNDELQRIQLFVREQQNIDSAQLSFRQFQRMMRLMQCRSQLKNLFQQYSYTKLKSLRNYTAPLMSKAQFRQFLKIEQQQKTNTDRIIWQIFKKQEMLSFHDFCEYIFSRDNSAYSPNIEQECINQQLPLTSYTCLSSHNTYLTGNQLTSDSRTERYLQDLQNGYRCLQIDIHNGDKQPIVKHGYTMTSEITFEDVIKCIAEFSLNNPGHTPIILSLQNHTNAEQQKMMASILKKYFGSKILLIEECRDESKGTYPTLKYCMGKIIIKNSGTYDHYKAISNDNQKIKTGLLLMHRSATLIQEEEDLISQDLNEQIHFSLQKIIDYSQSHMQKIQQFAKFTEEMRKQKAAFFANKSYFSYALKNNFNHAPKKHKIVPELLTLTAMLGSGSLQRPSIWQSISLSEGKINKIMTSKPQLLKKHTKQHWIRSYPSGARVDSSNYNPLPALELGVQIIALNSQNADHYSIAMRQYFRYGSKYCRGYRPKQQQNNSKAVTLDIRPISGFRIKQINESDSIPYVSVNMSFLGTQQDMQTNKKYAKMSSFTQIIKNNAYNPVFDNPQTMHLEIKQIEKAFLLISVPDCGLAVLALQGLRKGYRIINLLDDTFWSNGSSILFKFQ